MRETHDDENTMQWTVQNSAVRTSSGPVTVLRGATVLIRMFEFVNLKIKK